MKKVDTRRSSVERLGLAFAAMALGACQPGPGAAGPVAAPTLQVASHGDPSGDEPRRPEVAGDPSSAGGKYTDLLKTLEVPEDRATYGDFNDYGAWGPGEWAGAMQPAGYWVYVAPTWYIWRTQR